MMGDNPSKNGVDQFKDKYPVTAERQTSAVITNIFVHCPRYKSANMIVFICNINMFLVYSCHEVRTNSYSWWPLLLTFCDPWLWIGSLCNVSKNYFEIFVLKILECSKGWVKICNDACNLDKRTSFPKLTISIHFLETYIATSWPNIKLKQIFFLKKTGCIDRRKISLFRSSMIMLQYGNQSYNAVITIWICIYVLCIYVFMDEFQTHTLTNIINCWPF